MKILVIGGMHGNEPLGIGLVRRFQKKQVENIDATFANEKAIKANSRFVRQDLNRSFPGGKDKSYEQKRATYLLNLCRGYDLVFDFHNTYCPNNDCTFVGESANKNLFDVSAYFGLRKVIVADYECINKYAPNCVSIEISLPSKAMNTDLWYKRIIRLSKMDAVPPSGSVKKYRFVYRMTLEDKDRLDLTNKNLKTFKAIGRRLANSMGVKSPAYPIFIGDKYTPYNYGGLLNKFQFLSPHVIKGGFFVLKLRSCFKHERPRLLWLTFNFARPERLQ